MKKYISLYLNDIKIEIPKAKNDLIDCLDLDSIISILYNTEGWDTKKEELSENLATRVEITKKFYDKYTLEWKKHKDAKVATSLQSSLLTLILFVSFKKLQESDTPIEKLFKRINAIYKALDVSKESWIGCNSKLYKDIEMEFQHLVNKTPLHKADFSNVVSLNNKATITKEVPITILYSEGPIARAYLEIFRSLGIKPQKIIEMVSSLDVATRKPVGRFLPKNIRIKYARYSQDTKINFWPRNIQKKYPELQSLIFEELNKKFNISNNILTRTTTKLDISQYCDNIETVFVTGLKDEKLEKKLKEVHEKNILYTGGGIVPASLLSIKDTKFIHIHPGYLPNVRGADCTLWSSMIYKRAAATCFYMSPGIDTGDIIMPRWMPEISFDIDKKYNYKTLYRAVYSFVDPWIRAIVLREFLTTFKSFENIDSFEQKEEDGYTYYFMNEKVKESALNSFFNLSN